MCAMVCTYILERHVGMAPMSERRVAYVRKVLRLQERAWERDVERRCVAKLMTLVV